MTLREVDDLFTNEEIDLMTDEQLRRAHALLTRLRAGQVVFDWRTKARPAQLPPDGDWYLWCLVGGRGSGKTSASIAWLAEQLLADRHGDESAILAATFGDARDVCVEGPAGLLAAFGTNRAEVDAGDSHYVAVWNRSLGEVRLRNGAVVRLDGADDGGLRLQGHSFKRAVCDELGLWRAGPGDRAWDESLLPAVRLGKPQIVVATTPKPTPLMKRLLSDESAHITRMTTYDNADNLAAVFVEQMRERYEGTRLGRQELYGELLEDVEGALWKSSWFDRPDFRAPAPPGGWQQAPITGVDPADGTAKGAEHAYTTVALARDNRLYVIASEGMRRRPYEFACSVVQHSALQHSIIVLEANHGGGWLEEVFRRAMSDLKMQRPLRVTHAAKGKRTRAEPVAALYEPREIGDEVIPGRVRHVDVFTELEEQMCGWAGGTGETSPDRLDSLVWALSGFTGSSFKPGPSESQSGVVRYAEQQFPGAGSYSWTDDPLSSWSPSGWR